MQLGFALVVVLLTGSATFSLISARRAAERIDTLVTASLERERLIGLMRLDATLLSQAAGDHISAVTDTEREAADQAMEISLKQIQDLSERYAADLPKSEADLWRALSEVAEALVSKVDVTIKASNRKEAERARQHLEEDVKPINTRLNAVAGQLAVKNAADTRALLQQTQDVRFRTSALGAGVIAFALLFSLVVAWQVTRRLQRQEQTIESQLAELGRRNEELDAFASRVAHDLVSPLSPLKGYLTLARRQVPDENVKALLAQAESSTSRMSELVESLLRFCRAGKVHEKSNSALDVAVSTILLEQSQAASAANIELVRAIEADVVVPVAAQLLQSIAQNVVTNAVKYTGHRAGARVAVAVKREGASAVLEVVDNGPGMSAESLGHLFEPFFRAAETRSLPGTGLGLATTKRLVEAHGGAISVQSTLGLGTSIRVVLPLVPVS